MPPNIDIREEMKEDWWNDTNFIEEKLHQILISEEKLRREEALVLFLRKIIHSKYWYFKSR